MNVYCKYCGDKLNPSSPVCDTCKKKNPIYYVYHRESSESFDVDAFERALDRSLQNRDKREHKREWRRAIFVMIMCFIIGLILFSPLIFHVFKTFK